MRSPRPSYLARVARGLGVGARRHRQPAASRPQLGDVVLRGSFGTGFEIVDAITDRHIAGPMQLSRAIQVAKAHGAIALWQQSVDDRGRPLGPPARLLLT